MSLICFDIIRITTGTSYTYGTLAALPTPNGKVYMCRASGVSASVLPALTTVAASTYTDGTVEWLEYTPTGSTYSTTMQFIRNPKYGDMTRGRKYIQVVDYSAGGDPYVYDLGVNSQDRTELRWIAHPATEIDNLMDFFAITRGARFPFNYYDETGNKHKVIISNPESLEYSPIEEGSAVSGPSIELMTLSSTTTYSGVKLSLANGYAFFDLGIPNPMSLSLNHKLTVIDSTGKQAMGYIKAAGTGETYSADKVVNGGFTSDTGNWTHIDCSLASIAGGVSGNCLEITRTGGSVQYCYQDIGSLQSGGVYYVDYYVKSGTSGNETSWVAVTHVSTTTYIAKTTAAAWSYGVFNVALTGASLRIYLYKISSTAGTMLFDTVRLYQILTPATTGITITSTPNGTTYNWESIESGFNYNDTAYSYRID